MPNVLQNIVRFVAVPPATPTVLPHGLTLDDVGLIPDLLYPATTGDFTITADATNVTVTNNGGAPDAIDVFAWRSHSEPRALLPGTLNLTPQPFVVTGVGGGGGGGAGPVSIWAGGRESYDMQAPQLVVGAFEFQADRYTFTSATFRAVAAKGDTVNAEVELFNVTDAATVATLVFTLNAQTLVQSVDIVGSLPAASKIYEVRVNLAGAPGGSDSVELYKAELELVP